MSAQPQAAAASAKNPIVIRRVETATDRRAFVDLPYRAYRNDPAWRAPLRFEREAQIDVRRHPALGQMPHVLMLAVRDGEIYILEVNPRASRTVPFVGKATHVPWPKIAAKAMMGKSLAELGAVERPL